MGQVEKEARNLRRRGYLQKAVLASIALTGVLAVGLIAPNVVQLLGGFGRNKPRFSNQTRSVVSRLVKKGHVKFVDKNGKKFLEITPKGQEALEKIEVNDSFQSIKKPITWDKRWRLVVFDIPERSRRIRNRLRDLILRIGFVRVQNSVWVYPYDCEELVTLLKTELRTGKEVLYAVVEKIENDDWLRKHFNLK